MESNARTNSESERRDRIHGANAPDPIDRGRLAGSETSVRARWRVDTVPRDAKSNAPPEETESDLITLVQVRLTNPDPVEQRVSVRNALDGPVLFPRRRGVPAAGWGPNGFVGTVSAESERALGYACPASIRTPPIKLGRAGESRRANGNQRTHETRQASSTRQMSSDRQTNVRSDGILSNNENGSSTTPAAVVRAHGDARPPAAVIGDGDRPADDERGLQASSPASSGERADSGGETRATERGREHESALPAALTAWLDDIERRIARAERLEDASVREATDVLSEADGLDAALDGIEQFPEEAAELRTLAGRATELADRADAVAVPETALRRLV